MYPGRYPTLTFSHLDQFLCMAFAQLTYRESLRDIETCLRAHSSKLYHLGIRGGIAKSTLADANESRDWRIHQDFSLSLIQTARKLYAEDSFGLELIHTVYALDSTTIDLCLALFPWARFRKHKGAVKLHTLLDLRGNIPAFIHISDGKLHDVNILDQIAFEAGSFYVMDRGYIDFARLYALHLAQAFFVTRSQPHITVTHIYPMKTAALFLSLLLALPWLPAHAADEPEVAVTVAREGDTLTIDALMHVPVTPQEAWAVLADFEHFADFVPNMQVSRIVSKPGDPLRVEQKGKARYGLLSFSFESLREVELLPFETLKSRAIKGNMKKMETLTRLSAEDGGTRIVYHNEAVPDFWLPPLIGPVFIRHEVAGQFRAFIREMLRRNADSSSKH